MSSPEVGSNSGLSTSFGSSDAPGWSTFTARPPTALGHLLGPLGVQLSERVVAFSGSVSTSVTVTDFEPLGQLLLRLAGLEHAAVAGPWWQLRAGSRAGAEVRRDAIADALSRAREYAAAVGAQVDKLVEIADEGLGGQPTMRAVAFDSARESAGFDVDPQPQTVQATVTVRVTITEPDLTA